MGKFEQEASTKLLNRERIEVKTSRSFVDYILYPIRVVKNWNARRDLRRRLQISMGK
jgi:hypothetical protein